MAQLIVKVIEGKNLKKKDLFSENDAYVKLYLDDKKQKQKTSVQHDSKTPVWNETFIFNHTKGQDILHIGVYDKDLIFDDKIGSTEINLQELYERKRIDNWFNLPSRFHGSSNGQLHLILEYQPVKF